MKPPRLLTLILAMLALLSLNEAQAAPVRVAYSAISGAMAPLWVTQEGGYFRREGLEIELLYIGGGSLLTSRFWAETYNFPTALRSRWPTRPLEARVWCSSPTLETL